MVRQQTEGRVGYGNVPGEAVMLADDLERRRWVRPRQAFCLPPQTSPARLFPKFFVAFHTCLHASLKIESTPPLRMSVRSDASMKLLIEYRVHGDLQRHAYSSPISDDQATPSFLAEIYFRLQRNLSCVRTANSLIDRVTSSPALPMLLFDILLSSYTPSTPNF